MGEEPFDEAIIVVDCGTLFIRGGWGREEVYLGLASSLTADMPDILVSLSPRQRRHLIRTLREMCPRHASKRHE